MVFRVLDRNPNVKVEYKQSTFVVPTFSCQKSNFTMFEELLSSVHAKRNESGS